jgi:diacylglycerol kinase family enzyme
VVSGGLEDPRIQHYHVHRVELDSHPVMPVMVDGWALSGEGPLQIRMHKHSLVVMAGELASEAPPSQDVGIE